MAIKTARGVEVSWKYSKPEEYSTSYLVSGSRSGYLDLLLLPQRNVQGILHINRLVPGASFLKQH